MTVRKNANLWNRKAEKRNTFLMKKAKKKFMRGLKRFYSLMNTGGISPKRMAMAHVHEIIKRNAVVNARKNG